MTSSAETRPGARDLGPDGDRAGRAVLLSGSIGSGHDTLAAACAGSLEARGWHTDTLDSMALLGRRGPAAIGDWVFRRLLSIPPIYDAFHFNELRQHAGLARRIEATALRMLWPRLVDAVGDVPVDLMMSVFSTGASAAGRWKQDHPSTATVVFVPDQVAYGIWDPPGIDLFVVTSEATREWVRRFNPRSEAMVVTPPVRPEFYDAPSREAARDSLGIKPGCRTVLLMAGGWGLGPLVDIAARLADDGMCVMAVAGNNRSLAKDLTKLADDRPDVLAFGFTPRIAELMAAADVVITTPGNTCHEARAVGRGMVLLDVVPGHGRGNLQHELEVGHATVSSADPDSVAATVASFLDDPAHEPLESVGSPEQWEKDFDQVLDRLGLVG